MSFKLHDILGLLSHISLTFWENLDALLLKYIFEISWLVSEKLAIRMNTTARFRMNEIKWASILDPSARNKYNIYSINMYLCSSSRNTVTIFDQFSSRNPLKSSLTKVFQYYPLFGIIWGLSIRGENLLSHCDRTMSTECFLNPISYSLERIKICKKFQAYFLFSSSLGSTHL